MAKKSTLQRQLNSLLKKSTSSVPAGPQLAAGEGDEEPRPLFSPFIREQLSQALTIANGFMLLANRIGEDEGLAAVLAEAKRLEATKASELCNTPSSSSSPTTRKARAFAYPRLRNAPRSECCPRGLWEAHSWRRARPPRQT